MKIKISLTKKFLSLSLVSFLLLGFLLNFLISENIKNYVLKKNEHEVAHHIEEHADTYFDEKVFTKPDYQKNKPRFDEFIKAIGYLDSRKTKIYDGDSNIIYASDLTLVGQNYKNNRELEEALEGKIKLEYINRKKEQDTKESEIGNSLEVYVPIFFEEKKSPSGVIEVYFDISKTYEEIYIIQRNIWLTTGLSLVFLYFFLYWIFKSTSDLLLEKNRALSEVSKTLKMGQELDEAMLDSMGEGLVVTNNEGQILQYNPKVAEITGFTSADVMFRHYRHFIDIRDKEGTKLKEDPIKTALKEGALVRKTYKDEIYIKSKDGKNIPIAATIAPIFGKEAEPRGLVFTIHDARAEKELDKIKDEFVYFIAHELNNPIFTVSSYLEMILDDTYGKLSAKLKPPITTALSVSKQLSTLVADLLEVLRSESGQMKIELAPIDIGPVINGVVSDLSIKAKAKDIKIHYEAVAVPAVNANEIKVKEIVTNLIDNAIKYSEKLKNIYIKHEIFKDKVVTSVRDEGFGMSKEEKEHLFEKFYRIKNDQTKEVLGTGLGLFIVKTIIDKMGGEIEVESEKGKGTTFSFALKRK